MIDKTLIALSAALMLSSAAQAASPAEGKWRTPVQNGEVEISTCGTALCGRIVSSDRIAADPELKDEHNKDPSQRSRALKGLLMLQGFTGGPAEWKGGTVYNPEDGGLYKGSIRLVGPDTLKLTGCIVFPLCKTQTWTRVK